MLLKTAKAISDFRSKAPYSHFYFSSSSKVNQAPPKPPSRRKKWYKKWQKISPSYLEYMQFYGGGVKGIQPWWLDGELIRKLRKSGRYWFLEKFERGKGEIFLSPFEFSLAFEDGDKGDPIFKSKELPEAKPREVFSKPDFRLRLKGCGDRTLAPIEGTYFCDSQAYDALAVIREVVDVLGLREELERLKCLGEGWILTLPKELSEELDGLRGTEEWRCKIARLFNAGALLIRGLHSEGKLAMVAGLDLSGGGKPWEAHYHLNFYVFPVVRSREGKWGFLQRWIEEGELEKARRFWKGKVEGIFSVKLEEIDIKRSYLRSWGRVVHFVRYLFRHPLEDLWKGWKGFGNGKVTYSYRKSLKTGTLDVNGKDVLEAFSRVKSLPKSFKRIRWFGYLGNNQKGKTLKRLGFAPLEARPLVGWEKVGLYEAESIGKEAWSFKKANPYGEGEERLTVPVSKLCFCPSDTTGRRRIWKAPSNLGALVSFALRNGAEIIRPPP